MIYDNEQGELAIKRDDETLLYIKYSIPQKTTKRVLKVVDKLTRFCISTMKEEFETIKKQVISKDK